MVKKIGSTFEVKFIAENKKGKETKITLDFLAKNKKQAINQAKESFRIKKVEKVKKLNTIFR